MSFFTYQQQCRDCKKTWLAAGGVVGTKIIEQSAKNCPYCSSKNIKSVNNSPNFAQLSASYYHT